MFPFDNKAKCFKEYNKSYTSGIQANLDVVQSLEILVLTLCFEHVLYTIYQKQECAAQ